MTTSLPYAYGGPLGRALLRSIPEDFFVDEVLGFPLSGSGEHLFVHIEKRGLTTEAVARSLARALSVPARDVSYAGMKDRHAVTRQWFSIQLPGREEALAADALGEGVRVLATERNARKLRRGALRGNRFVLKLRDAAVGWRALSARLALIAREGVPNYFGEQRFGRDGDNVEQARAMFAGRYRPKGRQLRGILLSAVRSALFNEVLAERVRQGNWNQLLPGELVMLDGRHSLFPAPDIDRELAARAAWAAVHPTGPLPGDGDPRPAGAVAALEELILAREPELTAGLAAARVETARRALRLAVRELAWWRDSDGELVVSFFLTAGGYATTVIREILSVAEDARAGSGADPR